MTEAFSLDGRRIWVAGHRGMVGSALVRALRSRGHVDLVTATSGEVDLRDPHATAAFVESTRPDVLFLAAAKVGGIEANRRHPSDFLYDNLMIGANCLEAARRGGIQRVVVLGSSCVYPRAVEQPMKERDLWTGPLEPTNKGYAVAKLATMELAAAQREQHGTSAVTVLPPNLFGPGDDFDPLTGHVVASLLRRFHAASAEGAAEVSIWGSGSQRREFLHVDDLAEGVLHAAEHYDDPEPLNVGSGQDIAILELASLIADVTGFAGRIVTDPSKPDGMPRKLMDSSRIHALGWSPRRSLRAALDETYRWYLDHVVSA